MLVLLLLMMMSGLLATSAWREALQSPILYPNDSQASEDAQGSDRFWATMEDVGARITQSLNRLEGEEEAIRLFIQRVETQADFRWNLQMLGRMGVLGPVKPRLQNQFMSRLTTGPGKHLAWRVLQPFLSESQICAHLMPLAPWSTWSVAMRAAVIGSGEVRGGAHLFHEPGQQLLAMLRAGEGALGRAEGMLETADATLLLTWLSIYGYDLQMIEWAHPKWGLRMSERLQQIGWSDDPTWYLIVQTLRLNGHPVERFAFETQGWGRLQEADVEGGRLDWWLRFVQEHAQLMFLHSTEMPDLAEPFIRLLHSVVQLNLFTTDPFYLVSKWLICFVMRQTQIPSTSLLKSHLAPLLHLAATHHRLPLRCIEMDAMWRHLLNLTFRERGDAHLLLHLSGWMEIDAWEYEQESLLVAILYSILRDLGDTQLEKWSAVFVRTWLKSRFPIPVGLRRLLLSRVIRKLK